MLNSFRLQATGAALCAGLLAITVCGASLCHPSIAKAQAGGGAAAGCVGDCGGNAEVTVNELITMVNIALGTAQISACPVGDANGDGEITVNEIISAVNNALNGCPSGPAVCGNGVRDTGEECDNGGTCVGDNAGTPCTSDATCPGQGSCFDGPNANRACDSNTDCPSSTCAHCRPFGGDSCAANCTNESDILVNLKEGALLNPDDPIPVIDPTTSGIVVHADALEITIPLPAGGHQTFTVGKERDGKIPAVVRVGGLNLPRLPVLSNGATLACACLRGLELKTCGGTLNDSDGAPSTNCTADFTAGSAVCAGKKPCASVFGPGNGGALVTGCSSLDGANLTITQDSGGSSGPGSPPIATLSGTGPAGSAVLQTALSLGFVLGKCSASGEEYGEDGEFCTEDDSQSSKGAVQPTTLVTASASARITGADGDDTLNIPDDVSTGLLYYTATGAPLVCSAIGSGNASGSALAGVFTQLDNEMIGDIVVTSVFAAQ